MCTCASHVTLRPHPRCIGDFVADCSHVGTGASNVFSTCNTLKAHGDLRHPYLKTMPRRQRSACGLAATVLLLSFSTVGAALGSGVNSAAAQHARVVEDESVQTGTVAQQLARQRTLLASRSRRSLQAVPAAPGSLKGLFGVGGVRSVKQAVPTATGMPSGPARPTVPTKKPFRKCE